MSSDFVKRLRGPYDSEQQLVKRCLVAAACIEALEADVAALKKEVENSDAEAKAEAQKLRLDYDLTKALSEAALKRAVEAEVGAEKLRCALREIAQTADEIAPWCRTIALEALKGDSE